METDIVAARRAGAWLFWLVLLVMLSNPLAADPYRDEIDEWHRQRLTSLQKPDGWLSLIGLEWLDDGHSYTLGSQADLELPDKAPPVLARVSRQGPRVRFKFEQPVLWGDQSVLEAEVSTTEPEGEKPFRFGSLLWYVIEREGQVGLRIKDIQNPLRLGFEGIERFPVEAKWRVRARLDSRPTTVEVPSVLGGNSREDSPGEVVFTHEGREYRLKALAEPGEAGLFIIFADKTNGHSTYPAGRFLYTEPPEADGSLWLDFNKAYNPPCAFTHFATCPLPPGQNRLDFEVLAGEKRYTSDTFPHKD